MKIDKPRNNSVDAIRGIAMLLVVLGHTISISTIDFESTFVYQIIWTLQLPLFMMISGYVTRYSRPLVSLSSLGKFIKKRTLGYILPLIVWSILIRGIILGKHYFLDIRYMLWHMDSGYWFLASIWTICICYGIVDFFCNKIRFSYCGKAATVFSHLFGCGIMMGILVLIGLLAGLDFFCIKLTLYYFAFYLIGYLFGQLQSDLNTYKWYSKLQSMAIALCLGMWIYLIIRIDFFSGADSASFIILRFIASLLGCSAIIGLLSGFSSKLFVISGVYSIHIYLIHYLFLNILRLSPLPVFSSVTGVGIVIINYTLTLAAVTLTIFLINKNGFLNKLLFYKDN